MKITPPLPILLRLSQVIDAFVAAMWGYRMPRHNTAWGIIPAIEMSLLTRIRTRVYRAEAAIKSLMLRFRAGKLRPPASRKASTKPRAPKAPTLPPLPRHFAWLCPLMPAEAVARGHYLMQVLAEPEMQELLAASHRARAILKPICRMLAIDPGVLTPAPPPPAASSRPTPTPPPEPIPGSVPGARPSRPVTVLWRPQTHP